VQLRSCFHPGACPALAAANNKDGALYVWDRNHLADGPLLRLPLGDGIAPFVGAPAWSESKQMVYVGQSVVRGSGRRAPGQRRHGVARRPGLRLPSDLAGRSGRRKPGDAARGRQRGVRDRRKAGRVLRARRRDRKQLWTFPTDGRTVAAIISAGGQVFGADTAGVLYGFGAPPGMPPPCGPSCFRS
jgi:hypothetical protein